MIKNILILLTSLIIFLILCPGQIYAANPVYPLKISANQRYLVDQTETPFLILGDAAWSLMAQLSIEDVEFYLNNRKLHGFNTLIVSLIEHTYASNAPRNFYGQSPFTGTAFSSSPNEAYFTHADAVINSAAQKGINIILAPLYLGYDCPATGYDGWCQEVVNATTSNMHAWGTYVGNRYKNYNNIIWMIGGDSDPAGVKSKVDTFAQALKAADGRHLMTAHNDDETMAISRWSGATWLNLNNTYTYSTNLYQFNKSAYDITPVKPYFLLESAYENANATNQQLRAQTYWTILTGGGGHVFGNCPIWHFGGVSHYVLCNIQTTDWKSWLDRQGSWNITYISRLFASLNWHALVPDWSHSVLTSGYGTYGSSNYATTARSFDGSLIISYMPTARSLTFDMTKLSSSAYAQWYDPSTGNYQNIAGSPFVNNGSKQFTPPTVSRPDGSNDWILLLSTANSSSTPTPTTLLGDINRDNIINLLDYLLLSNVYNTNNTIGDLNSDGVVNINDYNLLKNSFGRFL